MKPGRKAETRSVVEVVTLSVKAGLVPGEAGGTSVPLVREGAEPLVV